MRHPYVSGKMVMRGMTQLKACFGIEKQKIPFEIDVSEVVVGATTHVIHLPQLHVHEHAPTGLARAIVGCAHCERMVVFYESIYIRFVSDAAVILFGRVEVG